MSSAILYVAIVAIWACVLIPRWLRHDSAHVSPAAHGTAIPGDVVPDDAVSGEDVPGENIPVPASPVITSTVSGAAAVTGDAGRARVVPDRPRARTDAGEHQEKAAATPPEQEKAPPPLTPEEARHRTLVARRRLLGMLITLEGAAIALAVVGLAALWVVMPPTAMLGGYLLLLREAAHADAERARREREAALARSHARQRARTRARAERRAAATLTSPLGTAATGSPAATSADYEDAGPGRDFAPGLAGKYTTSNADVIHIPGRVDEDSYDQYTQNKLRAVGD